MNGVGNNTLTVLTDMGLLCVVFFCAYVVRELMPLHGIQPFGFYAPYLLVALVGFFAAASLWGLYERPNQPLALTYLVVFLKTHALWFSVLVGFAFFTKTDYSRFVTVLFFVGVVTSTYVFRYVMAVAWNTESGADDDELLRHVRRLRRRLAHAGAPLLYQQPNPVYRICKRVVDIFGACAGLIVAGPVVAVTGYMLKRESDGPVLIRQVRVGEGGRLFTLYKLRTMYEDVDRYATAPRDGSDPRVTPVGRVLRRYSLDELPQLWNVIKGDMSLVGPRPEMPFIVDRYEAWQRVRLAAKPGLTGVWQIYGRKDLPLEENIEYDVYYVLQASFFFDLAVIVKTFSHIVRPRGAY